MRNIVAYILATLLLTGCNEVDVTSPRPNILLIVADDLGYTDMGAYGSEIRTPNLDNLAAEGLLLTDFYAAPTCSPTRAMLLSGTDHHLAGLGTMYGGWDTNQVDQRGYEAHLNQDVVSVSSILRDSGYHTYMAGKWHLGGAPELQPPSRGFEQSFYLVQGGASHFSDRRGLTEPVVVEYLENGEVTALPADFYSTTYYTDKMIGYIDQNRADGNPFFGYLAYTSPHWPLQVPTEDMDLYKGIYDGGYEKLREIRISRLRALGIIDEATVAAMAPPYITSWQELSADEQKVEARKMELYAAMVENLDRNIGRLINHLKETGEYENTFIMFMSDNGAEGNDIGTLGDNEEWIPRSFDNSLENMGKVNSYIHYGAGWAQASGGPFRDYKSFVSEGGIKVPAIIHYADLDYDGDMDEEMMSVKDLAPTLLELANTQHPGSIYKGREVFPISGKSLLPHLRNQQLPVYDADDINGWELFGRQAIRQGSWKMVTQAPPFGNGKWQLFNLDDDPAETSDLAAENPGKVAALEVLWQDYKTRNNIILPINGENPYALP
jgi:arylsulfatase